MKIACAMIVGPGESLRWLDRSLRRARHWADEIVVYGDGPDSDSWDAVRQYATHKHFEQHNRFPIDESAVRNGLLALLDRTLSNGTMVVVLDADEELRSLDGGTAASVLSELAKDRSADAWPVLFWHLWSPDGQQMRVDGGWRPAVGPRVYRHDRGLRVPDRAMACAPIPPCAQSTASPRLAIVHWGYARPHDRTAKHARYMRLDGGRFHSRAHLESIITEPTLEAVPCRN